MDRAVVTRATLAALALLALAACGDGLDRDAAPEPAPPRESFGLDDEPPPGDDAPAAPDTADPAPPDSAPADAPDDAPGVPPGPPLTAAPGEWTVGIAGAGSSFAGAATLVDVRVGRHDAFDRIVWTFAGGVPGWRVEYVDRPVTECGSGETVRLAGDAWLEVRMEPANAHDEAGRATAGPRRIDAGLPNLLEIARTCDFEAVVEYVAAVASPNPYRALALDDPPRLVVDVARERR